MSAFLCQCFILWPSEIRKLLENDSHSDPKVNPGLNYSVKAKVTYYDSFVPLNQGRMLRFGRVPLVAKNIELIYDCFRNVGTNS